MQRRLKKRSGVLCYLLVLLLQCSGEADRGTADVIIEGVPHVLQQPDFGGEACVEMVLKKLHHSGTQEWVFNLSGLSPLEGRGCEVTELVRALNNIGFDPGPVWYSIREKNWKTEIKGLWNSLVDDLVQGIPSIVIVRDKSASQPGDRWRAWLIVGYDSRKDEVIYHSPAKKDGAYQRIGLEEFFEVWPNMSSLYTWQVVRFRMRAIELKPYQPPQDFTDADYAQHYILLKPRLPSPQFSVVLQKPFFVIGDQPRSMLEKIWASGTIKWAVNQLKRLYFKRNPTHILDIWLFKDQESYRRYTRELWGQSPDTPFGYYSSRHRALVMNIATGGGTLIHELVHPFMETNFPDCPDWFNEGMGSLYEQSGERDGIIVGLTNWRLAGLQEAIREKTLPSFFQLTRSGDFYSQPHGYAQARYLCYYLQNRGLLTRYFHEFTANVERDPTGYETLCRIIGIKDMSAFQREWESWVLSLQFPPST